jgi:hypothetical protein
MPYGIIFWGNSTDSTQILKMQKTAIKITIGKRIRILAEIYLKILPLHNTYSCTPINSGRKQKHVQFKF